MLVYQRSNADILRLYVKGIGGSTEWRHRRKFIRSIVHSRANADIKRLSLELIMQASSVVYHSFDFSMKFDTFQDT